MRCSTVGGSAVIRISLPYIIDLSTKLEALNKLQEGAKWPDCVLDLLMAQWALENFLDQSVFSPYMRISRELGTNLANTIKSIADKNDNNYILTRGDVISINTARNNYKIALHAELNTLPSYFVTRKGGYDTLALLDESGTLMPEDLVSKVPEAGFDLAAAAKCLAFEVSTAAGFHIFRATESVLRRYYEVVANGAAPPKVRAIRVYVRAMRQQGCGNEKVLNSLDQMADLHRNPLIHPGDVLTTDEAIAILGIARSVITAMLGELPEIPPTTTHPMTSQLPDAPPF